MINPSLLAMAEHRVWQQYKQAAVPAGAPPMDPAAAGGGGMPPMDPAMMGGAPPPAGGMPPGGAPPMDPAMMGGAPPMAPPAAPMPGMPMDPMMGGQAAPQKLKPEQMMQMLDFRLYNMQQQLTAMMNSMGISVPAGALVTPPGSPTPVAEAAVPGGPQDPGAGQPPAGGAGSAGGGGASAIAPIDPMQGASPELAAGGAEKTSALSVGTPCPLRKEADRVFGMNGSVQERAAAVASMFNYLAPTT